MVDEYVLDQIGKLKRYYDNDGEEAIIELPDVILDDEYEFLFYELMYESGFFVSHDFNEETYCSKYFFSSNEMTEYFRLAKKIGRLVGWKHKENPYIDKALTYTIKRLDKIQTDGCSYGNVYIGTNHKYASSVNVYVYEEGFYDYEGLYFAQNAIYHYYESLIFSDHEYEVDGITYRYEDNTIYVSGDGDMPAVDSGDEHFWAEKLHVKAEDVEAVVIEEGITAIGENSFSDYKQLVTLELPESLEVIDAGAFYGCESLEDFEFSESLEVIGSAAFYGCKSLTLAFVPANVFKIDNGAFAYCDSITNVEISPSILGDSVFEGCPLLRIVAVYGDITSISVSSFENCESLYAILLTEEITEIGENAFSGCDGLELVEFQGTKKQWESIDIADGNDILDEVDISFGDGTMIERIGNSKSADGNDSDDVPSGSDTSKKTGGSKQLIAEPLSSKSGSGSAYAGLYKLSDGSFETSDGRLKTKLGKATVLRDGTSMTAEAEYDADPNHDERLMVDDFYRNESLYFSVPYSDIMTGDIYLHDDLKSDEETKQSYNWDPEGFYAGLAFAAIHGDGWKYPLHKNSEYEDLTVRVMYYEKDVEAVFYIYAKFKSSPYEIEALCAADLGSIGNNAQSGGGSNGGGSDIDFPCNRCGGSGDCPTCGGSGYEYKRGSDGTQIKTGCGTCYGSGKCPNPNCDNGRVKSN